MVTKKGAVEIPNVPSVLHFSRLGKALKSPDDYIISWARFNKTAMEWITEFQAKVKAQSSWHFNLDNSYLGTQLLNHSFEPLVKVKIYGPNIHVDKEYRFSTENYDFSVETVETHLDPMAQAQLSLYTLSAAFHTWPDETGKFKIFTHRNSRTARFKFKQPEAKTHLNRVNLKSAQNWNMLQEYIQSCNENGFGPLRKDVCDLVKTISEVETEAKQHKELVKMGIETPKHDIYYGED